MPSTIDRNLSSSKIPPSPDSKRSPTISLEYPNDPNDLEMTTPKIPDLDKFDPVGKLTIEQLLNGAWLSDTEIFSFLKLLKRLPEFKDVDGPGIIAHKPQLIKRTEGFIQVVLSNNNHWVCIVGGLAIDKEDVCLFDSMSRSSIDKTLEKQIRNLIIPESKNPRVKESIVVRLQNTQQQTACFCGYYALANAAALCYGLDPELLLFDQIAIRQHFIDCVYKKNKATMFPYTMKNSVYNRVHKHFYLKNL
jgi:hypothetical protein